MRSGLDVSVGSHRVGAVLGLVLACALGALQLPAQAGANDSMIGTQAGAAIPIESTQVRMDSEAVQILCLEGYALYRIDFKFVNETTSPQRVTLGFPFPDFEWEGDFAAGDHPGGFRAWLNGSELEVTPRAGTDTHDDTQWPVTWYAHEVVFPPGDSMVTVSYAGSPDMSIVSEDLGRDIEPPVKARSGVLGLVQYPYQVHTGAGWKGLIGKSVIRYTLGETFDGVGVPQVTRNAAQMLVEDEAHARNLLRFTQPSPEVFEWVYENYEPDWSFDPILSFVVPEWWGGENAPSEPVVASSSLEIGYFEHAAQGAMDTTFGWSWAEGAKGSGRGEWIRANFGNARRVREIRVWPGDQRDAGAFRANNRPKTLLVEFSDGTARVLRLADAMGVQRFSVDANAETAKVTILDGYEGSNGLERTFISEISFSTAPAPEFDTFERVTGIEPPQGHDEPQVLMPVGKTDDWDDVKSDYPGLQSEAEREAAAAQRAAALAAGREPVPAAAEPRPSLPTLGLLALASVGFVSLAAALGDRISRATHSEGTSRRCG